VSIFFRLTMQLSQLSLMGAVSVLLLTGTATAQDCAAVNAYSSSCGWVIKRQSRYVYFYSKLLLTTAVVFV